MAVTPASFRQEFKAFADPLLYSDAAITALVTAAGYLLNVNRWDPNIIDYGTSLFVAHHLVLAARDDLAASAGGIAGQVQGILISKQVDKVSAQYDWQAVINEGASYWNMSTYGIRFKQLSDLFGAGGMQLGIGYGPPGFWAGYGYGGN